MYKFSPPEWSSNGAWIEWCWMGIKGTKCGIWIVIWQMKGLVLPTVQKSRGEEYKVIEQVWLFFFYAWEAWFSALANMPSTENANMFSHMNSSNVHTQTHDILCKNTTFLTYLHCASSNRNECPFLYLNMSREYLDIWFKILTGVHPDTSYVKAFCSAWPSISACKEIWVYIMELQLCEFYETHKILWNLSQLSYFNVCIVPSKSEDCKPLQTSSDILALVSLIFDYLKTLSYILCILASHLKSHTGRTEVSYLLN